MGGVDKEGGLCLHTDLRRGPPKVGKLGWTRHVLKGLRRPLRGLLASWPVGSRARRMLLGHSCSGAMLRAWKALGTCLSPWHGNRLAFKHCAAGIGADLHAVQILHSTCCLRLWLMDRSHQDDSIKPAANTPEGHCHADGSAPLWTGQTSSGNASAS